MFKIYLSNRDENINAIDFYVKTIEDGIKQTGNDVCRVSKLGDILAEDIVVTLDAHSFFSVWRRNRKQKIINWFQGVAPEEIYYRNHNITGYFRMKIWNIFEKIALKYSFLNFFVSEEMVLHMYSKHKYDATNYILMPCFNQEIHLESFYIEKYQVPSFVYTGSLLKWQCFDKTISLFLKIRQHLPNATLTILTNDVDNARIKLDESGLLDVEAKSVPYMELNRELSKYKYGFLIREDMLINNVATPTKMSSYLSCGLIPVYSAVIKDFDKNLSFMKWGIKDLGNSDELIKQLVSLENVDIRLEELINDYKLIFDSYYNRSRYVQKISSYLNENCIS